MHKNSVVHGNLTPDSILFESRSPGKDLRVKLTGFKYPIYEEKPKLEKPKLEKPKLSPITENKHFFPPEYLSQESCDQKVDIWAIGCIAYYCLVGLPPITGESELNVFD